VHGGQVVDATPGQEAGVPPQVTTVGLQGVVGESALDDQVVEVGADRPLQRRRP
jgi:hypothetical protein